jgi:DNA-binding GntR family transcriptional regulator
MRLRSGGRIINGLGPSFFTKYFCFAGAGHVDHLCAILDANVATALNRCGWISLAPAGRGGTPTLRAHAEITAELVRNDAWSCAMHGADHAEDADDRFTRASLLPHGGGGGAL